MRTSDQIKAEIIERFGFFPPFFEPAITTPDIMENLWQQTLSAYVNNPIPPLFKEKLFAYLSRYCSVPYCIICHSCALKPMKMNAKEILNMLKTTAPFMEEDTAEEIRILKNLPSQLAEWPQQGTAIENSIFTCSVFIFLNPARSINYMAEMRRTLGDAYYNRLIEFLSYIKTCHIWVEAHPELSYDADKRAMDNLKDLIQEEPSLAELFTNYNEKVITEKNKQTDQLLATLTELSKANEKLQLTQFYIDNAEDMISLHGKDGKWLYINEKGVKTFGYSYEEFLKMTVSDIDDSYPKEVWPHFWQEIKQLGSMTIEANPKKKDGTPLPMEVKIKYVEFGGHEYHVSFARDITERKKAEAELRESEERFRATFEQAAVGIAHVAPDGRWLRVNQKICDIVGYSREELMRITFQDITHPDDLETDLEFVKKMLAGEIKTYSMEKRYIRKNRTIVWINLTVALVREESGEPKYFISVVEDITKRKFAEETVKKYYEEFEKIQRIESIGLLAGGIAHDFNNLLTSILGNISLAKSELDPKTKSYNHLEKAESASVRATGLTQQLLTFSKGGEPLKAINSVSRLLKDSINFSLSGSKSRCELSVNDNQWDKLWPVNVDEGQINQVFNNLIINADQTMPEGGIIQITCENVTIVKDEIIPLTEGKYIKVSIKDNGIGISESYLQKIFDPYFTTKERGKGLGLTTCFSIVKKHGGYITVESKQGEGTTFIVYLPAMPEMTHYDKDNLQGIFTGNGKILIMDDEEDVRAVSVEMLEAIGYNTETACDGNEAIEKYKNSQGSGHPFDVVIMDLTIPGSMGGKEAIKLLKEISPSIKTIVSSGYANDPIIANYKEYGFTSILTKPYTIENLSSVLHDVLKK